jgi:hypothetical protein
VPSLDLLADALGAVTSRKNATLTRLDWQYDTLEDVHNEMLAQALRSAEDRATLICRESHHRNLGIHSLTEKLRDTQEKQARIYADGMLSDLSAQVTRGRGAITKEDLGLEVSHAKTISLEVQVEYRVQPHAQAEHDAAQDGESAGAPSPPVG